MDVIFTFYCDFKYYILDLGAEIYLINEHIKIESHVITKNTSGDCL